MQPDDKPEFVRVIAGMAEVKPGKPLTKAAYEIWWQAMQGWSLDDFKAAASRLARTEEFMPNPYHFERLRKTTRETAAEAWCRVVAHAASSAYRNGPLCESVVDTCVSALGGYGAVARSEIDKLHFLERRFCEHFDAIRDAEETRAALPSIAGPPRHDGLAGPQAIAGVLANVSRKPEAA